MAAVKGTVKLSKEDYQTITYSETIRDYQSLSEEDLWEKLVTETIRRKTIRANHLFVRNEDDEQKEKETQIYILF